MDIEKEDLTRTSSLISYYLCIVKLLQRIRLRFTVPDNHERYDTDLMDGIVYHQKKWTAMPVLPEVEISPRIGGFLSVRRIRAK